VRKQSAIGSSGAKASGVGERKPYPDKPSARRVQKKRKLTFATGTPEERGKGGKYVANKEYPRGGLDPTDRLTVLIRMGRKGEKGRIAS